MIKAFHLTATVVAVTIAATITPPLIEKTNADGQYIINLAKLSSQWSVGESFDLKISKTGFGETTVTKQIKSGGTQTENLTFTEESNLSFEDFIWAIVAFFIASLSLIPYPIPILQKK